MTTGNQEGLWFVRAGEAARLAEEFISQGKIALGWQRLGQLSPSMADDNLDQIITRSYPDEREGTRKFWAGQLKRYMREIKVGDKVMTYNHGRRLYYLGTITSELEWEDSTHPRIRRVNWTHAVSRDALTQKTRYSLGSINTLFRPNSEAVAELWRTAKSLDEDSGDSPSKETSPNDLLPPPIEAVTTDAVLRADIVEKSHQIIEDKIASLNWSDVQELVAGILRAVGYKTRVSPPGPDRGVDISASPDGLGLQEPRIFVEVKHRLHTATDAPLLRSFLGGRRPGDRCLYVSSGGFTKDARYEADRATVPITLLTLADVRELLVEHYEQLDGETRALVPLKAVYWPAD